MRTLVLTAALLVLAPCASAQETKTTISLDPDRDPTGAAEGFARCSALYQVMARRARDEAHIGSAGEFDAKANGARIVGLGILTAAQTKGIVPELLNPSDMIKKLIDYDAKELDARIDRGEMQDDLFLICKRVYGPFQTKVIESLREKGVLKDISAW